MRNLSFVRTRDVGRRPSFDPSTRLWTCHTIFNVWSSLTAVRQGRQPAYLVRTE